MAVESAKNRHVHTVADDSYGAVPPWELFPARIQCQPRDQLLCAIRRKEADRWNKLLQSPAPAQWFSPSSKVFGLVPVVSAFRQDHKERWYYPLMMSTGLTFGTISALFGLTHDIVTQDQYSHLVAVVIGSAVVPTLIAGAVFLPRHLLTPRVEAEIAAQTAAVKLRRQTEPPDSIEEG